MTAYKKNSSGKYVINGKTYEMLTGSRAQVMHGTAYKTNPGKKALTKKTCAVLIEPIQGEGGVNLAQETYLKTLRKICNEKGILLI